MSLSEPPAHPDHGERPDLGVTRDDSGITVIAVRCELDMETTPTLRQLVSQVLEQQPPAIVVDLSRCAFLDSGALAAFLDTHKATSGLGIRLALVGLNRLANRVFTATGTASLFTIHPDLDAALAELRSSSR